MNREKMSQVLRSIRFSAVAALSAFALLFSASGAQGRWLRGWLQSGSHRSLNSVRQPSSQRPSGGLRSHTGMRSSAYGM